MTTSVSPQLQPADMATLAEQGITTVICNRPDAENPPPLQAAAMQAAAEAAGLEFVFNPVTGGMLTESNVDEQADAIAGSEGPVVAYLRLGQPLHHRLGAGCRGRGPRGRHPRARDRERL